MPLGRARVFPQSAWHKVLIAVVLTSEPFAKLCNKGMIPAFSFRDNAGRYWT